MISPIHTLPNSWGFATFLYPAVDSKFCTQVYFWLILSTGHIPNFDLKWLWIFHLLHEKSGWKSFPLLNLNQKSNKFFKTYAVHFIEWWTHLFKGTKILGWATSPTLIPAPILMLWYGSFFQLFGSLLLKYIPTYLVTLYIWHSMLLGLLL